MPKRKMFICPYTPEVSCAMTVGCLGCEDFKGVEQGSAKSEPFLPCTRLSDCACIRIEGSCKGPTCAVYDPKVL